MNFTFKVLLHIFFYPLIILKLFIISILLILMALTLDFVIKILYENNQMYFYLLLYFHKIVLVYYFKVLVVY